VTSALIPPVIPRRPAAGSRPRGTPAVVRTLPMAASAGQVPAMTADVVYGLGRIDASGRVAPPRIAAADRQTLLAWTCDTAGQIRTGNHQPRE